MTLPLSRNRTYVNDVTPVDAADLNDLQDQTIARYAGTPGIISPAQLSAGQNNWAPAGIETAQVIRLDSNANVQLTGLNAGAGQTHGRRLTIIAVGATTGFNLAHENAGSSSANRFLLPDGLTVTVPDGGAVELMYDGTSSRWRVVAQSL